MIFFFLNKNAFVSPFLQHTFVIARKVVGSVMDHTTRSLLSTEARPFLPTFLRQFFEKAADSGKLLRGSFMSNDTPPSFQCSFNPSEFGLLDSNAQSQLHTELLRSTTSDY